MFRQDMSRVKQLVVRAFGAGALCLSVVISAVLASSAEDIDFTPYAHAAEYCRGNVPRPLALSPDKRLLCFDGMIPADLDVSVATDLAEHGIAAFRSGGDDRLAAAELANALRGRLATIVVWDGCLLERASFILIASSETDILRGAVVAWGVFQRDRDHRCIGFKKAGDDAEPLLTLGRCEGPPRASSKSKAETLLLEFYRARMAGPQRAAVTDLLRA